MAVLKLSGIVSSPSNLVAADTLVGVHGGNTDYQFTGTQVSAFINANLPGSFTGFANPSASVGLSAVNGSATTAMRSDGTPPLDQTAAFVFSGLGNTTLLNTSTIFAGLGGASPATGVPGYSFAGGTQLGLRRSSTTGVVGVAGGTDVFSWTVAGIQFAAANSMSWSATASPNAGSDTFLTRSTAAVIQFGAANAASPVAQTQQVQGSRAGIDASTAGGNFTGQSGIGTGNVLTSSYTINGIIGNATSTTTAQTTAAAITVPGVASGQLPGAVIGSAAIATNATDGFLYIASGAGPPTGTPTAFTGRVPLYYDSTNDQLYIFRGAWKQPKTPAGAAIVNWQ